MIGTGKESAASTDIPTCLKKSPSGRKLAEISVVYFSLDM